MQNKTHMATLDGLRGVAALSVMLMHFSKTWHTGLILPRAYLAVDFFFALSGFVIAKSYEDRLKGSLSFLKFSKLRLQRLYPLILFATCLAAVEAGLRIFAHGPPQTVHGGLTLFVEFGLGILLLPDFFAINNRMFPLDAPAWSLFYEFGVNFLYAGIVRYLTIWRLVAVLVVAGVCLIHLNVKHGSADFGYSAIQFKAGAARVVFSFFAGVLLYRLRLRGSFAGLPPLSGFWLAGALLLTFLPPAYHFPWYYDPVCIFIVYPLIIAIGSEDHLTVPGVSLALWLGRLSYPVYLLHWPLIAQNADWIFHGRHGLGLVATTAVSALAVVLVSWLVLVFYDEPVRARLKRGLRRRPAEVLVLGVQDAG